MDASGAAAIRGRRHAVAPLVGWARTTLQPGDVVTLYVWKAKTGAPVGRFNKVDFADGTTMRDSQRGADDGGRADTGVRQ